MTDKEPFMPAPELGRSFRPGLGVNLLTRDVAEGVRFAKDVLGAITLHADEGHLARQCSAGSMDKPHGLRECVILDHEGYVWVPGIGIPDKTG
jgi:hypothetical protein